MAISKAVLITGCSSGIGHATAELLAREGWTVYATARRPETLADLERTGCKTLALDVTDEASMTAAVDRVIAAEGAVGVLINNAGYSQSGAVESVPIEQVRRQFETNVFGLIRMCQLVLPAMRAQHWGRIVNLSSMGGRLTFPGGGIYHATKYAVEAISDALRFEVRGFGVEVIIIEPGLIVTNFGETAASSVGSATASSVGSAAASSVGRATVSAVGSAAASSVGSATASAVGSAAASSVGSADAPYAEFNRAVAERTTGAYHGPLAKLGGGPGKVAKTIAGALNAEHPKPRYPVTASAHLMMGQRRLMPDRLWDRAMRTQFPTPSGP